MKYAKKTLVLILFSIGATFYTPSALTEKLPEAKKKLSQAEKAPKKEAIDALVEELKTQIDKLENDANEKLNDAHGKLEKLRKQAQEKWKKTKRWLSAQYAIIRKKFS